MMNEGPFPFEEQAQAAAAPPTAAANSGDNPALQGTAPHSLQDLVLAGRGGRPQPSPAASSGDNPALKGTAPQSLEDIVQAARGVAGLPGTGTGGYTPPAGAASSGDNPAFKGTAPQSLEDIARFARGPSPASAAGLVATAKQVAGLYGAESEATAILNVPVMPASPAPLPNESTRIMDSPLGLPGLPGMPGMPGMTGGRGPSLPPAQSLGHSLGGEVESTRIMDTKGILEAAAAAPAAQSESSVFSDAAQSEKSVYEGGGKSNRKKPVSDVKARSKAKVTPVDPGRLLVQQEAAEQRHREATMMGNIDQFLDKQSLAKLDDIPAGEGTIVGKFLGFVGFGAQGSNLAMAPVGKDPKEEAREAVAETPLLNGLNPQFISDAINAGDLTMVKMGRDLLIEMTGRALILIDGQISLARFKPEILDRERRAQAAYKPGDKRAEKKEMNRRQEVGPLIRMCETNLGLFSEGDFVTVDTTGEAGVGLAAYTVTPIRAVSISLQRLEAWRRTYHFFAERVRRASDASQGRIAASTGARGVVADFFVRHGLSVAMSLRVRELDKCIECYECEKACEERYGVKRLSLNGKVLGALDFVDCCHTCVDQRCIDPCAYDAIKFDDQKKEVVISEDACVGCSLCALACPYDAIEMHDLEEKPLLQIRLQRENKLGYGEGKARKAKLRRIASKCDHCVNYEDQACISACPTAALLEIPPEAAFTGRTESMADAAKEGFEHTVMFNQAQLFDPQKFFKGLSEADDKGRAVETKLKTGWLWAIGVLGCLLSLAEILLRKYIPEWSGMYYLFTTREGMEPELALANVDFRAGGQFALWLGYIGTVVMFSSMFYSAHKWIPGLKKLASQRGMFDYHVWAGTIGPILVMLHTAAKLDNWVSLAIYAMLGTVISGVIGRYFATELPDLASQASLQVMEFERKLADARNRHAGVNIADRFYDRLRKRYARVADPNLSGIGAGWMALTMLVTDSLGRLVRAPILRSQLRGIKDAKARTKVARLAVDLALWERRRVLYPKIEPMFREWKIVHIPFSIALTILSGIHIVIELLR